MTSESDVVGGDLDEAGSGVIVQFHRGPRRDENDQQRPDVHRIYVAPDAISRLGFTSPSASRPRHLAAKWPHSKSVSSDTTSLSGVDLSGDPGEARRLHW